MPFSIIRNDITKVKADAIVNTANLEPAVGEGVDSAIYRAAGWDELLAERRKIGRIEPGEARATKAYSLPAKYIIHTVGPVWQGGSSGEQKTLARCYRNSLAAAEDLSCRSVAFPLISTGTFGFPKDLALSTAISEISSFLTGHDIDVTLVVYNKEAFVLSGQIFSDVRSYIEESDVLVRDLPDQNLERRARNVFTGSSLPSGRKLKEYFEQVLPGSMGAEEDREFGSACDMDESAWEPAGMPSMPAKGARVDQEELDSFLKRRGETFQQKLFHMIDRKKLDDRDVYKRSNIDRKLFSKIKSNVNYNPTKRTVFAFAIGMELNLDETVDLLRSAGMAFSPGSTFDKILEYCISHQFYDIIDINCMLFDYGQPTLGA